MPAARRKKLKRFVLDTNVWISYAINGEFEWLARYVVQNKLLIYTSPLLISEIMKVLQYARIKKLLHATVPSYLNIITALTLVKDDMPCLRYSGYFRRETLNYCIDFRMAVVVVVCFKGRRK